MKNLILFFILLSTIAYSQTIQYVQSEEIFNNPERGIQKYSDAKASNYQLLTESTLNGYKNGADKVTVIYRCFYLNTFFTSEISQSYLNNMQTDFNRIRNTGLKVIIRFAYSFSTSTAPFDPTKEQMLLHIEQLKPILELNKDVILLHQLGFIGAYGEWYYTDASTEFGDEATISPTQWLNRKDVVDAMLTNFEDVPIQLRTAKAKQEMYGSTLISASTAYQNTALSRIGFFNDALFNSYGDEGTYDISGQCTNPVGSFDFNFVANAGLYLPNTGESNGFNPCDSGLRTSGANATYEFNLLNFSVINRDYYTPIWDDWIANGYYDEILQNMGYRLVLSSSTLSGNNLSLTINNVGYSKVLFQKNVYIVLRDNLNVDYKRLLSIDIRTLNKGSNTFNFSIPNDVPDGTYDLFLHISDKNATLETIPAYSIQLANIGLWENTTGYHDLQQTITISSVSFTFVISKFLSCFFE